MNGSGFTSSSVVRWNGNGRPTTWISPTRVDANIPATDIASIGTADITVFNPAPGGGVSNSRTFTISSVPVPVTTSIDPTDVRAGDTNFTLVVTGANFVTGSIVRWNGSPRPSFLISPTVIEADLETAREFPLRHMRYDGVIVTNYLHRPILADLVTCVANDGVLIYETFALGHERHGKPSNPDYLAIPNELIEAALSTLVVVAYEHGLQAGENPKIVARVAACGPDHKWAHDDPVLV